MSEPLSEALVNTAKTGLGSAWVKFSMNLDDSPSGFVGIVGQAVALTESVLSKPPPAPAPEPEPRPTTGTTPTPAPTPAPEAPDGAVGLESASMALLGALATLLM